MVTLLQGQDPSEVVLKRCITKTAKSLNQIPSPEHATEATSNSTGVPPVIN
jgi:hypothetical protein